MLFKLDYCLVKKTPFITYDVDISLFMNNENRRNISRRCNTQQFLSHTPNMPACYVHHVPNCMSCFKATGRAHCFHDYIYIMSTLLL